MTDEPTAQPAIEPPLETKVTHADRLRLKFKLLGGALASIAAVGAIIGGLLGYWNAWKAVKTDVLNIPSISSSAEKGAHVSIPRRSIAVLPFDNLSKDPAQDYFVEGLVANLTSDISVHIPNLLVISSASTSTYKGKSIDPIQVGRELRVRYLLTGNVQRNGTEVRVNAQLLDANNASILWTNRVDGDSGGLGSLQDKITERIATLLGFAMIDVTGREAAKNGAAADAADMVLQAQAALYKARRSFGPRTESEALFRKALALDPNNGDALIGLGLVLSENLFNLQLNRALTDEQIAKKRIEAIDFIDRGQKIKPISADLHYARFNVALADGRLLDGKREAESSLEIDPNYIPGYNALGISYGGMGEPEKALSAFMEGLARTGGRGPGETVFRSGIGFCYLLLSRWDEAIDNLLKARTGQSDSLLVHNALAAAYAEKGDMDAARASLADALKIAPKLSLERLRATNKFRAPAYIRLRNSTLEDGLRKAGLPEVAPQN